MKKTSVNINIIPLVTPDPLVYFMAYNKIREEKVSIADAIVSSFDNIWKGQIPEGETINYLNWKWEHVKQFRQAFPEIVDEPKGNNKLPPNVINARYDLKGQALLSMSLLCGNYSFE